MDYKIVGGNLPVLLCDLQAGEAMYTQSGGMGWMTPNMQMSTNMPGGLLGGIARKFSGESLFMTTYTCEHEKGMIAFPSGFPGSILPIKLDGRMSIIAQKRAFLAAGQGVTLSAHFAKRASTGFFGGEGFILQKLSGVGQAFLEIDGALTEYNLAAGQMLKVDSGCVGAFEETVDMSVSMVKGVTNILFGGEGLFLTDLRGPGKIWLQSMPLNNFAAQIRPYIPTGNS